MSAILPPGAQPTPQSVQATQVVPTAVVREPSLELLRTAVGTRLEGTVVSPPQTQQPAPATPSVDVARIDAARAAAQTLQNASDAVRSDTARPDPARLTPGPTQQNPPQQTPQVTVRTPMGDVTLRTPLPLPEGTRVAFDIASSNANQVTVRLASLNGQPIQQALVQLAGDRAAPPPPGTPAPVSTSPLGPTGPGSLTFGQVWTPNGPVGLTQAGPLNAFVLSVAPGGQAISGQPIGQTPGTPSQRGALPLLTGSDLTIRITAVTPAQTGTGLPGAASQTTTTAATTGGATAPGTPGSGAAAIGSPVTASTGQAGTAQSGPGQAGAATPGAPAAATTTASGQTTQGAGALLPSGGKAQSGLRLVGGAGWPQPPLAPPSAVQSTPVRLALTGIVSTQSTATQTIIQTEAGALQLANRANLPSGTTVTLDVLAQGNARPQTTGAQGAAAPPVANPTLPFTAGATPWPALTEALQVLQRLDPQASQLLSNAIPDGGPRTVVAALSFVQAMRTGDPRQWPGDNNLRALERAGPRGAHLARTISGEVAQLSAQSREATGEWRSTAIPWNADGQIEKISLITRRDDPPDDEKQETQKGKAGLRFLLDLDLTNLGSLQLDGMVREDAQAFDLMIRSHEPLTETIRHELTGLFITANQAVGLKGQLTFQVSQKFADPIGSSEPLKLERDGVWA